MPGLRRRQSTAEEAGRRPAAVPWALRCLLRDGPAPLDARPRAAGDALDIAIVLPAGAGGPSDAGLPPELVSALEAAGAPVRAIAQDDAAVAAPADVVLAAGWAAAPAVLLIPGVRRRAVLATAEPPPLAELGWTAGVPVLAPAWLGGSLPAAADAAYALAAVHRREDLVLVHGDDVLALLATAELLDRRPDMTVAVSGLPGAELPFEFLAIDPAADAVAHAFASATVAFAPPVRGWRPAAVAMLACGQPVVAGSGDGRATAALGDGVAFVASPTEAADAAERIVDDWELRGERVRAGLALVEGGWARVAEQLLAQLRELG